MKSKSYLALLATVTFLIGTPYVLAAPIESMVCTGEWLGTSETLVLAKKPNGNYSIKMALAPGGDTETQNPAKKSVEVGLEVGECNSSPRADEAIFCTAVPVSANPGFWSVVARVTAPLSPADRDRVEVSLTGKIADEIIALDPEHFGYAASSQTTSGVTERFLNLKFSRSSCKVTK